MLAAAGGGAQTVAPIASERKGPRGDAPRAAPARAAPPRAAVDTGEPLRFHRVVRWLLLVASLAIALALGEGIARVVVDDVYLERQIRSGGMLVPFEPGAEADLLTSEFRVRYAINRFGHRDRLDRRRERSAGVPRIALLGDSFAAGWGVAFEDTFGARFEATTGIEVVNAAKNGGCPLWFVPQARYLRRHFAPDWLLVQLFDNDADDNTQFADRFGLVLGDRVGELPRKLRALAGADRRLRHAFDNLVLQRRFEQLQRRLKGRRLRRTSYVKPGARPGAEILDRAASIAHHDVDLGPERPWQGPFSFHDPAQGPAWRERIAWNAQLLDQLLAESQAAGVPVAVLYIPAYPVFLRPPAPNPLADAARAVSEARGAPWIDAREVFAAEREPWTLYYPHDGHLDDRGHAAIARALLRALPARIRDGARPPVSAPARAAPAPLEAQVLRGDPLPATAQPDDVARREQ